jgi:hypothetical protein
MPYEDSRPPASKVRELIAYCESKKLPLIIGCDSNAHHTFWGSSNVNKRGEQLLEYLMSTTLNDSYSFRPFSLDHQHAWREGGQLENEIALTPYWISLNYRPLFEGKLYPTTLHLVEFKGRENWSPLVEIIFEVLLERQRAKSWEGRNASLESVRHECLDPNITPGFPGSPYTFVVPDVELGKPTSMEIPIHEKNWYLTHTQSFNFVTCHGSNTALSFMGYIRPFQGAAWFWILISLCLLSIFFCLIMRAGTKDQISTTSIVLHLVQESVYYFYLLGATLLKQGISTPMLIQKRSLLIFSFNMVFGTWLMIITVLSNAYEGLMVSDFVAPLRVTANWTGIEDLGTAGFSVYTNPFYRNFWHLTEKDGVPCYPPKTVPERMQWLFYTSEFYDTVHRSLYSFELGGNEFRNSARQFLRDIRICRPEGAFEAFRFKSIGCGSRVAFVDKVEVIERLTKDLKVFAEPDQFYEEGKSPYYVPVWMGWRVPAYHDQGMHRRMTSVIESGLLHFWRTWMNVIKPPKKTWSIPDHLELTRRSRTRIKFRPQKLASNIWSVFVVTFIGLGLAGVVLAFEMAAQPMKTYNRFCVTGRALVVFSRKLRHWLRVMCICAVSFLKEMTTILVNFFILNSEYHG